MKVGKLWTCPGKSLLYLFFQNTNT